MDWLVGILPYPDQEISARLVRELKGGRSGGGNAGNGSSGGGELPLGWIIFLISLGVLILIMICGYIYDRRNGGEDAPDANSSHDHHASVIKPMPEMLDEVSMPTAVGITEEESPMFIPAPVAVQATLEPASYVPTASTFVPYSASAVNQSPPDKDFYVPGG